MKYVNEKGEIAEVMVSQANADNKIRIQVQGEERQRVVDYDDFISEFRYIPFERIKKLE
ncbi:hypothetical protein [Moraxella phage Mcat9]|uniref:hypothetical protein n=1 Tax=Moraxella catarrhalis TaxID=480 RepID=UPI00071F87DF|nr:hypothetical protein [Moraxella catarrhalis]AKI27423.1 hypothetical protein [Moraxella phage Mcat9]